MGGKKTTIFNRIEEVKTQMRRQYHNTVKKMVPVFCLILLLCSSTSCLGLATAYDDIYSENMWNDKKMREAMFEKILQAFEEQSVEEMEELFSIYAKTKTLYLKDKIEKAFDFYEGEAISYEGGHTFSSCYEYGSVSHIIEANYHVVTDKNSYKIAFVYCPRNDNDRTRLGLHALQIVEESFIEWGRFFCVNSENKPGVYIQRSALTDEELEERNRRLQQ